VASRLLPAPKVVDVARIAKRGPRAAIKNQTWLKPMRAAQRSASTEPGAVEAAALFPGLSLGQNVEWYGQDQEVEPADAQVAASPSALVEIAGNTMAMFGSDGSVQWSVDLQALFQLPAGYFFYSPSLQYDYRSSRWFLGGIASNTNASTSRLLLAVSRTANPFGSWSLTMTNTRQNTPSPNTVYFMHESLAVTDDKVVQANQAQNCSSSCIDIPQASIIVVRKAALVAGVRATVDEFLAGDAQKNLLAVQPQSLGSIAYLVWLKVGGSPTSPPDRLGLLQITGVPYPDPFYSYRGSTTVWEKDFSASVPSSIVLPAQPGGSLVGSPTPITSAVYRDGMVVLAMNDLCGPTPDPRQVDCVRIIKLTNFGNATPVATEQGPTHRTVPPPIATDLDITLGLDAADLFDASLAIDPFGNLFVTAAFSSSDRYLGMAVAGISAPISPTSTVMPSSPIAEGPARYDCSDFGSTWGAYMRSVPDPNDWSHVWMPGEAALGSCDWATAIASATMGMGPRPERMGPTFGSTKGGQQVEIDGSYFVPNAQDVLFGSSPGTILAESSTVIIVSAPPGMAGVAPVTVVTPDGSAGAGGFTYVTPGVRVSAPPAPTGSFRRGR
jgi:IPT/TIG domain-containing protein